MKNIKDKIAWRIAFLIPNRIVLAVIVRAFAWATSHEYSNKSPNEVGYSDVYKSWEKRMKESRIKD